MKSCKEYMDFIRSIDQDDIVRCASCAKVRAGAVIAQSMEKARGFSIFDFAMLKLCLLTLGLWLGSQFTKLFSRFKQVLFITFAFSWVYLMWRVFFHNEEH